MTRKIIIDTDPGQDDAVAILLALASPELEVLGLTTVAGNVPLALTTRNAQLITGLSGKQVPIVAGRDRPLNRQLVTAEYVHGQTGLDGIDLGEPHLPVTPGDGVDFIIDTLRREAPGTVTVVPIGPLTNIAAAFARAPDIIPRVQQVVLMGGAYFEVGNVTPTAEFNIYVDPEAAAQVLNSGVDVVMMPLDVTHKALTSADWLAGLRALGTRAGEAVASWTDFFERYDREKYGAEGAPLHDPCTIAYLIRPELFSGRRINVEIETEGRYTTGMTVADWWGVTGREPNALFIRDIDRDGFFTLLTKRIATLD